MQRGFRVFVHEWLYVVECFIGPASNGHDDLLLVRLDQADVAVKTVTPGSCVVVPLQIDDALFTLFVRRGHGPVFDLELTKPRARGDVGIKRLSGHR